MTPQLQKILEDKLPEESSYEFGYKSDNIPDIDILLQAKDALKDYSNGYNQCRQDCKSSLHAIVQSYNEYLIGGIERVDLQVFDKEINPEVISFYQDAVSETKRVIINLLNKS